MIFNIFPKIIIPDHPLCNYNESTYEDIEYNLNEKIVYLILFYLLNINSN